MPHPKMDNTAPFCQLTFCKVKQSIRLWEAVQAQSRLVAQNTCVIVVQTCPTSLFSLHRDKSVISCSYPKIQNAPRLLQGLKHHNHVNH